MVLSLSGMAFSDEIENTKVCIGAFLRFGSGKYFYIANAHGYSLWSYYLFNLFLLS
jgi:hypothetical protein